MSGAESGKPERTVYATETLREVGTPFEPEPLYTEPPPAPVRPASPAMAPHIAELCERCRAMVHPKYWNSPPAAPEMVQHFNEWQTAYVNTALDVLAEITGDRTYRENRAFGITTLAQLFILSEPADGIRNAWQVRPSQVERGAVSRNPAVEVIDIHTAATPVEPVAPSAPEPAPECAADMLYDEPGDGSDLYRDQSGDVYPKGGGDE